MKLYISLYINRARWAERGVRLRVCLSRVGIQILNVILEPARVIVLSLRITTHIRISLSIGTSIQPVHASCDFVGCEFAFVMCSTAYISMMRVRVSCNCGRKDVERLKVIRGECLPVKVAPVFGTGRLSCEPQASEICPKVYELV